MLEVHTVETRHWDFDFGFKPGGEVWKKAIYVGGVTNNRQVRADGF